MPVRDGASVFWTMEQDPNQISPEIEEENNRFWRRTRRFLFGKPRSFYESSIFHRLTLIPILAWIGLGADGLSSSAYGPEEAFRALGTHTYLAFGLALATAITVIVISAGYSRLIEEFPNGGGYVVASKLLGPRLGVVSGCALLVDYALTIAVSTTAAGDALFSLLPLEWQFLRLPFTFALILGLIVLNIRGVRESVLTLAPIFFLFLVTHAVLIITGLLTHAQSLPQVVQGSTVSLQNDMSLLGLFAMLSIFMRAYSMGGGTYTGIEAVSNSMSIMREPRVKTARRTMLYMAISLSLTAAGLIICYLLWDIAPETGRTMNAVLAERIGEMFPFGRIFVILTLLSAGGLLVVAAQAGFLGGPRVLVNMAIDSWVPRRFAALSERLTTMNGIVMMGTAALALVAYTRGNTHNLVLMYSINVFLTFSLSMFGMLKLWIGRKGRTHRKRRMTLFAVAFLLCATVLIITTVEKFTEGGWLTIVVTGCLVTLCFAIHSHYRATTQRLTRLNEDFAGLPIDGVNTPVPEMNPTDNTAAVLVGGYSGLGIHTLLNVLRAFPDQFRNIVFLSVGVIDSGEMKGAEEIQMLKSHTEEALKKYIKLAGYLGLPATYRMSLGTDVVEEASALCFATAKEFPRITFFSGQLVFQHESWYHRLLHNQTAFSIQRRLFWEGKTMVILPVRVR